MPCAHCVVRVREITPRAESATGDQAGQKTANVQNQLLFRLNAPQLLAYRHMVDVVFRVV
jgi:hypothetical protein